MDPGGCLIKEKALDIVSGETKHFASNLNFKQSCFNQDNCYFYANSA